MMDARAEDRVGTDYRAFLEALKTAGFEGDIAPDVASRTVFATDNSIYQRLPQAVLFPRHVADLEHIARLAAEPAYRRIVLTPRGGGTGTNGQSLTDGVMIDVSRHMNHILDIDVTNRRVRVQAGVVKDQLNTALKPYGLFFAPELSTSNRATIGGMISTDASGQGSCRYGKTRDHVLELDTVLLGGQRLVSRPLSADEEREQCQAKDRLGDVYRVAARIIDEQKTLIEAIFPPLNRCLTGYDLAHLRDAEGRLNVNSLLCGSEGSLGFISEAVLNVLPIPRHATLVNVRYPSFMDALRDAKTLMGSGPISIETVDDTVLTLAMADFVWDSVATFFPSGDIPIRGINLVEFSGDDAAAVQAQVQAFIDHLQRDTRIQRLGVTLAEGREQVQHVYAMRKRAVGLLGNVRGEQRPIPFVEDTAVPPERLAEFIAEFRALLDGHGVAYGMFGHVDAGVLHVRPALDMKDPRQARLIRTLSDEVAALTQKYGGLLWGEHGKGVRSEYAPAFFGALYPSLQRIKAAFDPFNQLNPGKIASPDASEAAPARQRDPALLAVDAVPTRGELDRTISEHTWRAFDSAVYCNGNGACYNYALDDPMCPSWKATRDRIHSPKGRASLMREWLRREQAAGNDVVEEGRLQRRVTPFRRLLTWPGRRRRGKGATSHDDFAHEVYDAMAGCLACKSCAGQCPIKVNVPQFRAQFLEVYHGRYRRPLRDYVVGATESLMPVLARLAPLYNALLGWAPVEKGLRCVLGLSDSPRLCAPRLDTRLRALGVQQATVEALAALTPREREASVVLVQDAFTTFIEAPLVEAIVTLLSRLGVRVFVMPYEPNGKPLQVHGFLGAFARIATRQAKRLQAISALGVPLVGVDPAMTLTYRQEYVQALGRGNAPKVALLQEWLSERLSKAKPASSAPSHYRLLTHCTEKTNVPGSPRLWQQVFSAFGLELELIATGCCGMSGTYGHETRNLATSRTIYAQSWQPVVEAKAPATLLATGYSCRSQVKRFSNVQLQHPLQALLQHMERTSMSIDLNN
ncbi:D-2-hydroxyglutarate dehydrogenase YdiJ [Halomonas dongshanensis]|uniref:FAD-binding oxidoreductase n=1 Tax=Halomonas dongshanensis TaxID=2890835 RepID=A0ABT2E8W6_9GAMM|nr:FAD-binding and (Fe-S)-binding domain-containing protein [Halomonas dongshanensis]MCS2608009.1 FAD-binding oxidoreductase [Halomonas dongshanensis]